MGNVTAVGLVQFVLFPLSLYLSFSPLPFISPLLWPLVPDAAVPSYGPYGRYSMLCVFVSVGF